MAGSVSAGKRARAPRAAAPHLVQPGKEREGGFVSQGHVDQPVVGEGAHAGYGGALLPSALGRRRHEDAGVFAPVAAGLPLLAGGVPECFPLRGEVAVAGGDAEEKGVVCFELVGSDCGDIGFRRGVHFGEDFGGKSFGDSMGEDVSCCAETFVKSVCVNLSPRWRRNNRFARMSPGDRISYYTIEHK